MPYLQPQQVWQKQQKQHQQQQMPQTAAAAATTTTTTTGISTTGPNSSNAAATTTATASLSLTDGSTSLPTAAIRSTSTATRSSPKAETKMESVVEPCKGLDELANLEDTVSHNTKRLLASSSSMISKSAAISKTKKKQEPPQATTFASDPNTKNWNDLMAGKKNVIRAGASSTPPSGHQHSPPTAVTFNQKATAKPLPYPSIQCTTEQPSKMAVGGQRHVDWPTRPKDATQGMVGSTKQQQQTPNALKPSSQTPSKPLPHPSSRKQPCRRQISSAIDGWSASPDTSRSTFSYYFDSIKFFSKMVGAISSPMRFFKRRSSSSLAADAWKGRDEVDKLASLDPRSTKKKC